MPAMNCWTSSALLSGSPKSTSSTPSSAQRSSCPGSSRLATSTTTRGRPSRPLADHASWSAATRVSTSVSIGVVIHPSAWAAIQSKFFGVPPAPTRIGMRGCWSGLGQAQLGAEAGELPVVRRDLLAPQLGHQLEVLAQHGASPRARHPVVLELLDVPAEPDAESHPAPGEVVEGGQGLGQRDRVVLHRERHRRAESDGRGHGRSRRERDPWVEDAQVTVVRDLPARAGVCGVATGRDVGVLRHVERVEAGLLCCLRRSRRGDPPVAREQHHGKIHGAIKTETRSIVEGGVSFTSGLAKLSLPPRCNSGEVHVSPVDW